MKMVRSIRLSLEATFLAVLCALVLAALVPALRSSWPALVFAGTCYALVGWLLFFLPVVLWEVRTRRRLAPPWMALLGCAFGAVFPVLLIARNGWTWFCEWHTGLPMYLAALAVPVAALAGLAYATLRPQSAPTEVGRVT